MTEEEFYIEQLLRLQQSYQKDAEPIINKLAAIRARDMHPMFVFMDMERQSVAQQQISQTVKAEVIK